MNTQQLKNLQAPLKEKYKSDPNSAIVVLQAHGKIGNHISCKIETGKALVEAGLHPATGGTGTFACSGDMLLEALVACAGVTLSAVATSMGLNIEEGDVSAEGDLDFSGTLGVNKEAPVGFKNIRLKFDLKSDATDEQLESLKKLTERYCVVYQTLFKGVEIKTHLQTNL